MHVQPSNSLACEPVTILHPTGHTQYYRRANDYFTAYRLHTVLQESVTIVHPTGNAQYYRRTGDGFTELKLK